MQVYKGFNKFLSIKGKTSTERSYKSVKAHVLVPKGIMDSG